MDQNADEGGFGVIRASNTAQGDAPGFQILTESSEEIQKENELMRQQISMITSEINEIKQALLEN